MENFNKKLKNFIKEIIFELYQINDLDFVVEAPKDQSHGDLATNIAMVLTKTLKRNPLEIAEEIKNKLYELKLEEINEVSIAKPGFINFKTNKKSYVSIIEKILTDKDIFGSNEIGKGKNIIIEFSSPNIAKPFTIGHLRSTIIGDSIAKILEFSGYKIFKDNHLGDWGASFGKYLAAFDYYNVNIEEIKKSERPIKELVDLYIRYTEDSENNSELKELGRDWFKKLEEGNATARQLWEECINISFIEFDKIYNKLGITFTENNGKGYGESFFEHKMQAVLEELKQASKENKLDYHESEGAQLVFFPNNEMPPLMILKSNGTTLYSTRDLATDKFRKFEMSERYGEDLTVINETGIEQSLYWKQIFKIEEMLGWYQKGERVAITHGLYRFKEGKMSTRKGNVIWLEDVLNESVQRASKISTDKEVDDIVAQKVGIGAIKWNDLKRDPRQDILFDWDEILNLKGNSSPYIQYTYVRANKIGKTTNFDFDQISPNEEEFKILVMLYEFPEVIKYSAQNYQSSSICNYLFNLSQAYSAFYEKHRILNAENENVKNFRIALSQSTAQVIKNGLYLLGIDTVEQM